MSFFAELLYRNEEWQAAAEGYDQALALSDEQGSTIKRRPTRLVWPT